MHHILNVSSKEVEMISSFKFLVVHISHNLSWSQNIFHITKKAHLFSLRLKSIEKSGTSEILTCCIIVC